MTLTGARTPARLKRVMNYQRVGCIAANDRESEEVDIYSAVLHVTTVSLLI